MTTITSNVIIEKEGIVVRTFAYCATFTEANRIADEMNRLNREAARITGKAIQFIYKAIIRS